MNGSSKPTGVSFGLLDQTVDALELTLESLSRVPARMASWKWAVIGLHAALQGSFGLVLERTDGSQLLIPEQDRQYQERVDREKASGTTELQIFTTASGKPKDETVDWFLKLFYKTLDEESMSYMAGVPLRPTAAQTESIQRLHSDRGRLIHFGRTGLVLDAGMLLRDLANALDVIETLLFRTRYMSEDMLRGPIGTIAEPTYSDRARDMINHIRTELLAVHERYGLD